MSSPLIIDFENHRSRERVKEMGEVFTPEKFVHQMMDRLDDSLWSNESTIFFEPTCGHGNILLPVFIKRYQMLQRKFAITGKKQPELMALSIALNTLWGVDICKSNIELARRRLLSYIVSVLREEKFLLDSPKNQEFLTHILCSLIWQINENEAVSALSSASEGGKTRLGAEWLSKNAHKPLNFSQDWCRVYLQNQKNNSVVLLYKRAYNFISSDFKKSEEFGFASGLLNPLIPTRRRKSLEIEVS